MFNPRSETYIDLFKQRVEQTPDLPALMTSVGGHWKELDWAEFDSHTDLLANGLMSIGVKAKEKVAILSRSCMNWVLADLAILKVAGCVVPVHADALDQHVEHVLVDSGSTVVFVENERQLAKVRRIFSKTRLEKVILIGGPTRGPTEIRIDQLVDLGRKHQSEFPEDLSQRTAKLTPQSLASIVYTAGTTGLPKGVMLTHDNLVFECESIYEVMRDVISTDDLHLACLPLSHILARIMMLVSVRFGFCTAFSSGLDVLEREMLECRPSFMTAVPVILERIHASLLRDVEKKNWIAKRMFSWARRTKDKEDAGRQQFKSVFAADKVAKLVLSKLVLDPLIKERFGGRLKLVISGGAPLATDIAEFLHSLGLLVLEGYGMTENTGAANVNRHDRLRFGTVGPPLPGVELHISKDGEILLRGRNVMLGYHGQPEATKEVLDKDGWLHTGDIGRIDTDGFLKVTGRKKDIIVTSGGKNVAPQNIEKLMRTSSYIDQIMVYGHGCKYLVALVSVDQEQIQRYAEKNEITFDKFSELVVNPHIRRLIQHEIEERNIQLVGYETIRRFAIAPEPFSLDSGEIAPSRKLRRQEIEERYRDILEDLYEDPRIRMENIALEDR
jgi:long-chain acyl-CoA synthetase